MNIKIFIKILLLSLVSTNLLALEIDEKQEFNNLLLHSQIYIDKNSSLTVKSIEQKHFLKNSKKSLAFGYSPNFTVWIKFKLENPSSKQIDKIIEYANPLTTNVTFFDPSANQTLKDGFIHANRERTSTNPIFSLTLPPRSSTTFYLKASTTITTMIVKLHLWKPKAFEAKERRHQLILILFLGAIGIVILYNLLILLTTKDRSYLYYVLFFMGMVVHHLFYRGVAPLYLSSENMARLIEYSSFIVLLPIFALALFIQNILELKQYPKLYKAFRFYLFLVPSLTLILYTIELYRYRNIFSILLLLFIFFVIIYALYKANRQASYVAFGMTFFISSAIFMQLSSLGIYDIFEQYPYYTEVALIIESLIFSLSLANRIRLLYQEKIALQEHLIGYQKEEKARLNQMVEEKTQALKVSLEEKELLLKELNHRVKNSIQTIVSFLRLQIDDIEEKQTQQLLKNIENRIMSISHLYSLLYTKENICFVDTHEYFSLLIEDIESSYAMPNINITIKTEVNIPSEYAIYCGFILNENITNSLQHAFKGRDSGEIFIHLKEEDNLYKLSFFDNGIGYNSDVHGDSLGLVIMETLVVMQLKGKLKIASKDGTKIDIEWRDNE